jgi:hypothetical protein
LVIGLSVGAVLLLGGALWAFRRSTAPAAGSQFASMPPPSTTDPAHAGDNSIVGIWKGWFHLDTDPPGLKTPMMGTFRPDGTLIGESQGNVAVWQWRQSGALAVWTNGTVTDSATITGNHMVGTISYSQHTGFFEADR